MNKFSLDDPAAYSAAARTRSQETAMTRMTENALRVFIEEQERDRVTRNNPSGVAVLYARALLAAEPRADVAVIPMYWPGKEPGWWVDGQEVCTVPGVVFVSARRPTAAAGSELPSYSWARDAAADIAWRMLGDREGVAGWASVRRDSAQAGVFEDHR